MTSTTRGESYTQVCTVTMNFTLPWSACWIEMLILRHWPARTLPICCVMVTGW